MTANGKDLAFINVRIVDKDGNLCHGADRLIKFGVRGAGIYRAAANGDPVNLEPFHHPRMLTFGGQLTAIVQTTPEPGPVVFEASAGGIQKAEIELLSE
jgi:beta-galactosidase